MHLAFKPAIRLPMKIIEKGYQATLAPGVITGLMVALYLTFRFHLPLFWQLIVLIVGVGLGSVFQHAWERKAGDLADNLQFRWMQLWSAMMFSMLVLVTIWVCYKILFG